MSFHRIPRAWLGCAAVVVVLGGARGASAAQIPYRTLVQNRNPVTYLMLDETSGTTAADSGPAASPNPGTYPASGVTLGRPSAGAGLGTAILSNGTNTPITFAPSSEFDNIGSGDFSVEMWFNTSNITSREDLLNLKNAAGGGSDLGIQLSLVSTAPDQLTVFHNTAQISPTTLVTANVWHHLALTRLGSTGAETLYLDGAVIGTATDTQTINTSGGNMTVGNKVSGTPRIFSGLLDEFAFYNTVLSPADIQADIAAAPEPASGGLLAVAALGLLARRRRMRHTH